MGLRSLYGLPRTPPDRTEQGFCVLPSRSAAPFFSEKECLAENLDLPLVLDRTPKYAELEFGSARHQTRIQAVVGVKTGKSWFVCC